jgi:pimeloyl-ACP methyl ester carboxylesterase
MSPVLRSCVGREREPVCRRMAHNLLCVALVVGVVGLAPVRAAPGQRDLQCIDTIVPVSLVDTGPITDQLPGTLCYKGDQVPMTVQLLVHGGTYDRHYWDWPVQNTTYSYVKFATDWGYATLAFDRIGNGQSTHPPGLEVNLTSNIATIHQVVQALRRGDLGRRPFPHVVYVGHSIGAQLAWKYVSVYQDVDAVIIGSTDHQPSVSGTQRVINGSYPAHQDPQFAHAGLDNDYLTSKPGTHGDGFYNVNDADSAIIASDEQLKGTDTNGELSTILPLKRTFVSQGIHVPTLLAMGEFDNIHCQADTIVCTPLNLYNQESPYYAADACLSVLVVKTMGHDMNLQLHPDHWFQAAQQWIDIMFGSGVGGPRSPCDLPLSQRLQLID